VFAHRRQTRGSRTTTTHSVDQVLQDLSPDFV
jgi:hypothetical protein